MKPMRALLTASLAMLLCGLAQAQVSAQFCGPLHVPPAAAPWDFRRDKHFLPLVENAHFTVQVELLLRGQTGNKPAPDIDYTLGRFPNHPRALIAVTKLGRKFPDTRAELLPRPVECYFERGMRFAPDDLVVRMLYAQFLIGVNRRPEALQQLATVDRMANGNPLTLRSLGLIYVDMKEYELARQQAWRLQAAEPEQTAVREALERDGQWREAPAAQAASQAAPAAASEASR
jgi:hypothetical protein